MNISTGLGVQLPEVYDEICACSLSWRCPRFRAWPNPPLQDLITSEDKDIARFRVSLQSSSGGLGDEVAGLIARLVGPNGLSDAETLHALAIIHATFEKPESIDPSARVPLKTLQSLHHLADQTDPGSLKQQITDTIAYVQAVQPGVR